LLQTPGEKEKIMVQEIKGKFQCEECEMLFEEKKWAQKCEEWCKEHKSCNIEIIKHAAGSKNA
jgi:Zn finger protein HypA/HybF involved in hydrogenase expression